MGREDEIRTIAYGIWVEEGCRDGNEWEHWLKAEVIWENNQNNAFAPKKTRKKSRKAAKPVSKGRLWGKKA